MKLSILWHPRSLSPSCLPSPHFSDLRTFQPLCALLARGQRPLAAGVSEKVPQRDCPGLEEDQTQRGGSPESLPRAHTLGRSWSKSVPIAGTTPGRLSVRDRVTQLLGPHGQRGRILGGHRREPRPPSHNLEAAWMAKRRRKALFSVERT